MNFKRVILAGTALGLLASLNGCSTPMKSEVRKAETAADGNCRNAESVPCSTRTGIRFKAAPA